MEKFLFERLEIADVIRVTPRKYGDSRGHFSETYVFAAYAASGIPSIFVQDNQSLSTQQGTIRGLHFQRPPTPQAKLVRAIAGAIFDVAVDLRKGSPSYGHWCSAILTAESGAQLFVPQGFAHGFCTLEPNTVVTYKVDNYYDPATDGGIAWDSPSLAITWPVRPEEAIVSDKDKQLPDFQSFETPF